VSVDLSDSHPSQHRLKVSEVGAYGLDFDAQDDLVIVGDGLHVGGMQEATKTLDESTDRS
jgi:hypothetical protein